MAMHYPSARLKNFGIGANFGFFGLSALRTLRFSRRLPMLLRKLILPAVGMVLALLDVGQAQSITPPSKIFDQQGLTFEYAGNWELGGQPTGDVQQLVLVEKALDAQIMIIAPRALITSAKEEESATQSVIEPTIKRLLKQYDDAGIAIQRSEVVGDVAGLAAHGVQLRFSVDGQQGFTDIYWLVLNQRLVQLIFVRPEKTLAQSISCWDLIRRTLKIHKV
jgi:hypothetical protein